MKFSKHFIGILIIMTMTYLTGGVGCDDGPDAEADYDEYVIVLEKDSKFVTQIDTPLSIDFTIDDQEISPAWSSINFGDSVSDDTSLLTTANIVPEEQVDGESRPNGLCTLTLTPETGQTGYTTAAFTVISAKWNNWNNDRETTQLDKTNRFSLWVLPDSAPGFRNLDDITFSLDAVITHREDIFEIGDADTTYGNLLLSASSDNQSLIPDANINIRSHGFFPDEKDNDNHVFNTVTVTALSGQTGTANITISANDGTDTTTETFVVTVTGTNQAPTADIVITNQGVIDGDLTFYNVELSLAGSTDSDGTISTYTVDWGEGDPVETQATSSFIHGYFSAGSYTITATVTDNDGDTSDPVTTTITATLTPPPTVTAPN